MTLGQGQLLTNAIEGLTSAVRELVALGRVTGIDVRDIREDMKVVRANVLHPNFARRPRKKKIAAVT